MDQNLPFIAEVTALGLVGQPYGMDSAQFVSRYVPGMRSIVELRNTLHEVGREQALAEVAAAWQRLRLNALIGGCILALEAECEPLITELRQLNHRDHLTGLMNRRAFDDLVPAQLAQAERHRWPLALLLFDLESSH